MAYLSNFSFIVLISVFMQAASDKNFAHYSKVDLYKNPNSYQSYSYAGGISVSKCGVLCAADQCCMELLYNHYNRQCVQLYFSPEGGKGHLSLLQLNSGFGHYRKSCPHPWTEYNNHCYLESQKKVTWMEAKAMRLFNNPAKYTFHLALWARGILYSSGTCSLNVFSNCSAWTSGNDLKLEGQYGWNKSNVTMNFTYWHPNEPSVGYPEKAEKRDCVDLLRTGKWNDRSCAFLNSFICEKSHVF